MPLGLFVNHDLTIRREALLSVPPSFDFAVPTSFTLSQAIDFAQPLVQDTETYALASHRISPNGAVVYVRAGWKLELIRVAARDDLVERERKLADELARVLKGRRWVQVDKGRTYPAAVLDVVAPRLLFASVEVWAVAAGH